MKDRHNAFQQYVTRVAFNLNLSAEQCCVLLAAYDKHEAALLYFGRSVPALSALIRKGLLVHHERSEFSPSYNRMMSNCSGTFKGERPAYTLTRAGELAAEMLVIAGFREGIPQ